VPVICSRRRFEQLRGVPREEEERRVGASGIHEYLRGLQIDTYISIDASLKLNA